MVKTNLPPAERLTAGDAYRLALGAIAIILGSIIFARTIAIAASPPAILVSLAFIGLGAHRLWLGFTRLREMKRERPRVKK